VELKDFIGKVVVGVPSNKRYILSKITAACIVAREEKGDAQGHCASYRWDTVNGDPISTGALVFEEAALKKPFQVAYEAYCRSQEGRWEEYGYWLRKD
jgi:hypothetical protein